MHSRGLTGDHTADTDKKPATSNQNQTDAPTLSSPRAAQFLQKCSINTTRKESI